MWTKIKAWCKNSLTIAWARIQVAFGAVVSIVAAVDLLPAIAVLPAKWVGVATVLVGIVTELARRRTL